MLRAIAKPRSRVSRSSDSLWRWATKITVTVTSPITIRPNVRKMRAWRPAQKRRGRSAAGLASIGIVARSPETELFHGQRRDSQRIDLEPRHLVAEPDERRGMEQRDERGRQYDQTLHGAIRLASHP